MLNQAADEQKSVAAAEAAWFREHIEGATLWKHVGDVKGLYELRSCVEVCRLCCVDVLPCGTLSFCGTEY